MRRALGLLLCIAFLGCEDPDFTRPIDASVGAAGQGGQGGSGVLPGPGGEGGGGGVPSGADSGPAGGTPITPTDAGSGGSAGSGGMPDDDARPVERDDAAAGGTVVPDAEPDARRPPVEEPPDLAGAWVSEGADLAPLLAGPGVNVVRVDVHFDVGGTYSGQVTDRDNRIAAFSGRYTVDAATRPFGIALEQTDPQTVRSEGIFTLAGDVMTYEVAQVRPPLNGVSAPTAAASFGSTSGGNFGRDNVQTYRRTGH